MMSIFRLLRARLNCVTPAPPSGSFRLIRSTLALSLYSATGLPCCPRYERSALKQENSDSESQNRSSID